MGESEISIDQTMTVTVRSEQTFIMSERDWSRLRRRIKSLDKQQREFSAAAWTGIGVLISGTFGAIAWAPAFRALGDEEQLEFAWVMPTMISLSGVGFLLAVGMFWAARAVRDNERETAKQVIDDMDAIHTVVSMVEIGH